MHTPSGDVLGMPGPGAAGTQDTWGCWDRVALPSQGHRAKRLQLDCMSGKDPVVPPASSPASPNIFLKAAEGSCLAVCNF